MNYTTVQVMTESTAPSTPIERFIEEMGLIVQEGGAPRIAGRIFGLLIVEGRELSLHQIADRLGVSRASVSTNARMLASRGLLRHTAHSGDRQDYYELAPFHFQMMAEIARQFDRYARMIGAHAVQIEPESPPVASRIRTLANFYQQSSLFMDEWSERLRVQEQANSVQDQTE